MMGEKRILIAGGGTAGWMAACYLAKALGNRYKITLVESPDVGTIGVGEGSTPLIKQFFDFLGIEERAWMPACDATYKVGIRFQRWSTVPGYGEYFHPFYNELDGDRFRAFIVATHMRRAGLDVDAHPDGYGFGPVLAREKKAPVAPFNFPFNVNYGYHFDAGLVAKYLRQWAEQQGVEHSIDHIEVVESEGHNIVELVGRSGTRYRADHYLDCTGFASLLIKRLLPENFLSYEDSLFNDSAVTLASAADAAPVPETASVALSSGWMWRIPLQSRVGYGYVYSSHYQSDDAAASELRKEAGVAADHPVRHLKMRVGRRQSHWVGNCVALGLCAGFIEPLEATALALNQQAIERFRQVLAGSELVSDTQREQFNRRMNESFDQVKNYVCTHYLTNSRDDTPYWIAARKNTASVTPALKQVFNCWYGNEDLEKLLSESGIGEYYCKRSWFCILAGTGLFPPQSRLAPPTAAQIKNLDTRGFADFYHRCATNFPDQSDCLNAWRASD